MKVIGYGVSYTYRFQQFVLRSLIGSTAEEVARRLGISAEMVDRIVESIDRGSTDRSPACAHRHSAG